MHNDHGQCASGLSMSNEFWLLYCVKSLPPKLTSVIPPLTGNVYGANVCPKKSV